MIPIARLFISIRWGGGQEGQGPRALPVFGTMKTSTFSISTQVESMLESFVLDGVTGPSLDLVRQTGVLDSQWFRK